MSKDSNCQTMFEGEQRPSCEGKLESEIQLESKSKLSDKGYNFLSTFSIISFAIFTALMIAFMLLLPVARIKALGLNEKYGTILSGERFDEIRGLNGLSIVLFVLSIVAIFYTIVLLQYKFSVLKYVKAFGKPLYRLLQAISVIFVVCYLVISIIIIGKICEVDDGMRIIRVASYPILTLAVSAIYLVFSIFCIILCCLHEKLHPEIMEKWIEEGKKAKAEIKEARAKKVANRSAGKIVKLIVPLLAILAVTGVAKLGNVGARFQDKPFDSGSLKEIVMEDAGNFNIGKSTLESIIGSSYSPNGAPVVERNAVYYTENYVEFLGRLERNQKYALLAIEQGDSRISKLLKNAKNLEIEQETIAYGMAEITYSESGNVQEVVYDNVVVDGFGSIAKKLESVKIFEVSEKYSDDSNTTRTIKEISYLATYKDGSFIYKKCSSVSVVLEDGTTSTVYEGGYAGKKLKWHDEFGSYEVIA
ncbi:MAG: hypothetical protein IJA97_05320 [Clostridia bacterium]|nr:hypothetical protein [Clostridia bacterium]